MRIHTITRDMMARQRAFASGLRDTLKQQRDRAESQRSLMETQQTKHRGGTLDLKALNAMVIADESRAAMVEECELTTQVRANLDHMIATLLDVRAFLAAMEGKPATRSAVTTLLGSLRGFKRRI